MTQPFFSIVIANYNYGHFLEDAIRSVLNQNMGDQVELIICDAASTDNSVEIIKHYANGLPPNTERYTFHCPPTPSTSTSSLITWWCSEPDGGQSAAFNKGFSHACGKFLTWLNADDVLMPGALKAIMNLAQAHPDAEWLTGSSVYADKALRITRCFVVHRFSYLRARCGDLMVGGPSSFFTKRLLDSVGGVDESLHYVMDLDLWNKFFFREHVRYYFTRRYVFAYRKHEESKMSGADVKVSSKALENRKRAHEESLRHLARYGKTSRIIRMLVTALTMSPVDKLRSTMGTSKWKGVFAADERVGT